MQAGNCHPHHSVLAKLFWLKSLAVCCLMGTPSRQSMPHRWHLALFSQRLQTPRPHVVEELVACTMADTHPCVAGRLLKEKDKHTNLLGRKIGHAERQVCPAKSPAYQLLGNADQQGKQEQVLLSSRQQLSGCMQTDETEPEACVLMSKNTTASLHHSSEALAAMVYRNCWLLHHDRSPPCM